MHRVLSAFARAAAGDSRALAEAREAWADLAAEQQALLASLGKLLAAAHERSAALPEVLDALAARDLDRARREFRGLATEERELIGAIGRYLADRGERTLPLLGAFDGVGDGGPTARGEPGGATRGAGLAPANPYGPGRSGSAPSSRRRTCSRSSGSASSARHSATRCRRRSTVATRSW